MANPSKDEQMYDSLVATLSITYPGFEVRFKDQSSGMKLLGKLMFWNKKFMTGYTTTIGDKVYWPSEAWLQAIGYRRVWKTLAHEAVHIADYQRLPMGLFYLLYLSPQVFALASIPLAFISPWFLFLLLLAAPLPSPGRKWIEIRGYTMSMAVNYWRYGSIGQDQKDHIVTKFTGPDYLFSWPFVEGMYDEVDEVAAEIETGAVLDGDGNDIFKTVYDLMRANEVTSG